MYAIACFEFLFVRFVRLGASYSDSILCRCSRITFLDRTLSFFEAIIISILSLSNFAIYNAGLGKLVIDIFKDNFDLAICPLFIVIGILV